MHSVHALYTLYTQSTDVVSSVRASHDMRLLWCVCGQIARLRNDMQQWMLRGVENVSQQQGFVPLTLGLSA